MIIHGPTPRLRTLVGAVLAVMLVGGVTDAAGGAPRAEPLGGQAHSMIAAIGVAPTLASRDRLLFQGLIVVTLALTLAVLVQSRVLDGQEDAAIPEKVRRFVSITDVFITSVAGAIGAAMIVVSLDVLSYDRALTTDDRTLLRWDELLVAGLGVWVFTVALWRRALPVLWRRCRSRPWQPDLDHAVVRWVVLLPTIGVSLGVSFCARNATVDKSLVLVGLMVAWLAMNIRSVHYVRRRDAQRLETLEQTADLWCDDARLAGFVEADAPRVEVLRKPGSMDVWLTVTQARDVAVAFDWAKRNVDAPDDRQVRMRSVKFRNKWYRGWWPLHRDGTQVFRLSVIDGQARTY